MAFGLEGEVGRAFEADPDDLALARERAKALERPARRGSRRS